MKKIVFLLVSAMVMISLFALLTVSVAAEDKIDVSENHYTELPVRFDPQIDCFEIEDLFDDDGSGFNRNTNGIYDYYYLKGEYGKTYMTVKFNVEQEGTYDVCIGLMAIGSTVPRSAEWQINGGQRYYVSRLYEGMDSVNGVAEYIDGITAYFRAGENTITFYSGYDFDNVNVKSVFIDKVFYTRTGDLPHGYEFPNDVKEEETVDITGAVPEIVKFNENFKNLVVGSIYCSYDFTDDAEKGNVLRLTVTDSTDVPRFSFSYKRYMKLLGLDPETATCDKYGYLVLSVKSDDGVADGTADLFAFADGNDIIDESQRYCEYFDIDAGWQYIIYELADTDYWTGSFDGGYFLIGSSGCEEGAVIYVSDIALFETLDEAEKYAGLVTSKETTAETEETTTSAETEADEKTTAPENATEKADETTSESVTTVAGGETTTAAQTEEKKSGCGGTVAALAVISICPIAFLVKKKKND